MQSLTQIKTLLASAGLAPRKKFGQCFLFDKNLMAKMLDLADLTGTETVLEVGPGTGSMTEDLLDHAGRVVAVEIDRGLGDLLARTLGARENFTLVRGDVLAGKHAFSPAVLAELDGPVHLVANLPYNIATSLVAECLLAAHRAHAAKTGQLLPADRDAAAVAFERLTFMVQAEVADRFAAKCHTKTFGPVSILASVLGQLAGTVAVPASAFWPRPKVTSRMLRFDLPEDRLAAVRSAAALSDLAHMAFAHRRKQLGYITRNPQPPYTSQQLSAALAHADIPLTARAEAVPPAAFAAAANALATPT
jgi:16S rRNA (adenine1518-N6/adenine1519-N6)-dimethyltransferase